MEKIDHQHSWWRNTPPIEVRGLRVSLKMRQLTRWGCSSFENCYLMCMNSSKCLTELCQFALCICSYCREDNVWECGENAEQADKHDAKDSIYHSILDGISRWEVNLSIWQPIPNPKSVLQCSDWAHSCTLCIAQPYHKPCEQIKRLLRYLNVRQNH